MAFCPILYISFFTMINDTNSTTIFTRHFAYALELMPTFSLEHISFWGTELVSILKGVMAANTHVLNICKIILETDKHSFLRELEIVPQDGTDLLRFTILLLISRLIYFPFSVMSTQGSSVLEVPP